MDTQNTLILNTQNTNEKKFWTHEITTRVNFGPSKYRRENVLDPQRHDRTKVRDPRDSRNLTHSQQNIG